ncbi:hypothetical protein NM208_g7355 [Fusarium decemcellulare]|uniref:Uncharacterized protein n=1 Tax=Fusarium decemcellulare TaxID=57161 RepID=A0ACC1S9M7_9HYPO|nr:hypothetical protein NM208_g7355 [Fusarium decemcellulare]
MRPEEFPFEKCQASEGPAGRRSRHGRRYRELEMQNPAAFSMKSKSRLLECHKEREARMPTPAASSHKAVRAQRDRRQLVRLDESAEMANAPSSRRVARYYRAYQHLVQTTSKGDEMSVAIVRATAWQSLHSVLITNTLETGSLINLSIPIRQAVAPQMVPELNMLSLASSKTGTWVPCPLSGQAIQH